MLDSSNLSKASKSEETIIDEANMLVPLIEEADDDDNDEEGQEQKEKEVI